MEISVKPNCKIAIFAQKHQDTPKSAKMTYAHRANALYIYTQMHPCSNVRLSGVSNGNGPQWPPPPPEYPLQPRTYTPLQISYIHNSCLGLLLCPSKRCFLFVSFTQEWRLFLQSMYIIHFLYSCKQVCKNVIQMFPQYLYSLICSINFNCLSSDSCFKVF